MRTGHKDLSKLFLASIILVLLVVLGTGLYFASKGHLSQEDTPSQTAAVKADPSLNQTALKTDFQIRAFAFAEAAEIYVQDGHSLRLNENQPTNCSQCYAYVFDHYGDPDVLYELTVRINDAGHPEWVPE